MFAEQQKHLRQAACVETTNRGVMFAHSYMQSIYLHLRYHFVRGLSSSLQAHSESQLRTCSSRNRDRNVQFRIDLETKTKGPGTRTQDPVSLYIHI